MLRHKVEVGLLVSPLMIEVARTTADGPFPISQIFRKWSNLSYSRSQNIGKSRDPSKMSGEVIGKKKGRQTERVTGQTFIYIQIKRFFDCQFNQLLTGHIILRWNVLKKNSFSNQVGVKLKHRQCLSEMCYYENAIHTDRILIHSIYFN